MVEITGLAPPRFSAVKDAFARSFEAGEELGARFTLVEGGEVVLDLMGGWADRKRVDPFGEGTLVPVFSSTKAVARAASATRLLTATTTASASTGASTAG